MTTDGNGLNLSPGRPKACRATQADLNPFLSPFTRWKYLCPRVSVRLIVAPNTGRGGWVIRGCKEYERDKLNVFRHPTLNRQAWLDFKPRGKATTTSHGTFSIRVFCFTQSVLQTSTRSGDCSGILFASSVANECFQITLT